ncbi:MAG: DUF1347 family protein, partial [Chlamydiia bacterium]|nr:DUF1347 family protein [Chlamydiia bacterium]
LNMAAHYFENVALWSELVLEKKKVIDEIHKSFSPVISHLFIYPELIDPVFSMIQLLGKWQEESSLKLLAHALGDEMILSLERDLDELLAFCQLFGQTFGGHLFHSQVMERCFLQFSERLKERDTTTLLPMWQLVNALSETPTQYCETIARLAETEIYTTIILDTPALTRTQMTLSFYKQMEKDPAAHHRLASQLLNYGKLLWQREGQETKGTHLMDLALAMTPQEYKEHFHRDLEIFLSDLFTLAEKANTVRRLSLLHDTLAHFQISRQSQASPIRIANYLADGFYLYSTNQYYAAEAHADWVLKLDPYNQEAIRLQGLTYYHQGKYNQALASLKRLESLDQISLKALILSDVFSSQENQGQIAQTDVFEKLVVTSQP